MNRNCSCGGTMQPHFNGGAVFARRCDTCRAIHYQKKRKAVTPMCKHRVTLYLFKDAKQRINGYCIINNNALVVCSADILADISYYCKREGYKNYEWREPIEPLVSMKGLVK